MIFVKMKKGLSVLLAILMLTGVCSVGAGARTAAEADTHLQFKADGTFRIMQIADIQDDTTLNKLTKKMLRAGIEQYKPDLLVLTGDNIGGYSCKSKASAKKAIQQYMDIFKEYDVPVAMVFGNHDDQDTKADKAYQMEVYESYSNFIGCRGEESLSWYGTYNIPIYSSTDRNDVVFNVWMFDSGNYNDENDLGGYGCPHKDQIDWYTRTSRELQAKNGGEPVPSIAFQHIIVPEIWDALKEVPKGTDKAVEHGGKYYVLPDGAKGELDEAPCPPEYSNGQFAAMQARGDVLAMFFGHDHVNTFSLDYQGVTLATSPGCTFASYGNDNRGFRFIDLNENDPWNYTDDLVDYKTLLPSEEDTLQFNLTAREVNFGAKISAFFKVIIDFFGSVFGMLPKAN